MPNIGPMEIAIVAIVALLIFGPKRLPEAGRGLGRGLREFKEGITGRGQEPAAELEAAQPVAAAQSVAAETVAARVD